MLTLIRRFRSPLVAIVAVVFSASIVLAAQPASNSKADQHRPAQAAKASEQPDESAEPGESPDATDANDAGSADHCNVDLTQDPSVLAGLNHGSVVCTAAHMATPAGYANHGAWVSHWAKMNHGAATKASN